jgi:hypothetical protein
MGVVSISQYRHDQAWRVWVACRSGHGTSIVIGVFQRASDARDFIDRHERRAPGSWSEPRPGHQQWRCRDQVYTYTIEETLVRTSSELVAQPRDCVLATTPIGGRDGYVEQIAH